MMKKTGLKKRNKAQPASLRSLGPAGLPERVTGVSLLAARTALSLSSPEPSLEALLALEPPSAGLAGNPPDKPSRKKPETAPSRLVLALELAERLLTAVDADSIFPIVLEALFRQLGFDACQYVACVQGGASDRLTGQPLADDVQGEVFYEIKATGPHPGRVHSYSHAGLEGKRRTIRDYAGLLARLEGIPGTRPCLRLDGEQGWKRSSVPAAIFGIQGVHSALLLPVIDMASGEIRGTLHCFRADAGPIPDDTAETALDMAQLTSRAFSRALVLEKALALAASDELTGLMNRRGYYQRFESEIERARRHQTPLCVALLDVDHFKRFNDTYGHLSGDLILKTLAELFAQNMRKSDVICRFGGEEFAILLPDTSLRAAADLIDRLRQAVERLEIPDAAGALLKVTISAGLTEVDTRPAAGPHDAEISEALSLADEQLYLAKNTGRNRVRYAGRHPAPVPHAG
jgi:diguanylate cyclase (GGDEF)-like protein